jgi:hypothetical protein
MIWGGGGLKVFFAPTRNNELSLRGNRVQILFSLVLFWHTISKNLNQPSLLNSVYPGDLALWPGDLALWPGDLALGPGDLALGPGDLALSCNPSYLGGQSTGMV